ncbi:MAG: hypothetical protein ABIK89_15375 [Planctomycetota bacterium]
MRRCPECRGRLWHHINRGTVKYIGLKQSDSEEDMIARMRGDGLGNSWAYGNYLVCLECREVDCMVEGCSKRATVGREHYFKVGESGSVLDRDFLSTFRNDLWFCREHGSEVKRAALLRLARNGSLALGVIGITMGFLPVFHSRVVPIVFGALLLVLGIACGVLLAKLVRARPLNKKAAYIEKVRIPSGLEQSKRSQSGPWVDDRLY